MPVCGRPRILCTITPQLFTTGGGICVLAASEVVTGKVHAVFFFVDALDKHPHDPDIQTLLRACNVHDVPLATNVATADLIISAQSV